MIQQHTHNAPSIPKLGDRPGRVWGWFVFHYFGRIRRAVQDCIFIPEGLMGMVTFGMFENGEGVTVSPIGGRVKRFS